MLDAVERGEQLEGLADAAFDLDVLPEPAARAPLPTGVWPQLLLPEDQWGDRFRDFDWCALDTRRIGGGRQPVGVRPRAGAAVRRDRHREPVVADLPALDGAAHDDVPE